MHLFDPNENPVESPTPFIVTVILLSLAAYAVPGWGLWLVDNGHRGDTNNKEADPRERARAKPHKVTRRMD